MKYFSKLRYTFIFWSFLICNIFFVCFIWFWKQQSFNSCYLILCLNINIFIKLSSYQGNFNFHNNFINMDLRDFEGLHKYKFIMPSLYIISWISLVFGPYYFPALNQLICLPFIIIASLKFMLFGFISFYLLY